MPVPAAGIVRLSDAGAEFGAGFRRLGALFGVAAGVPVSGRITLADLRGTAASVPATTDVSATVDTAGGPVSGTRDFATQAADTYGAPLSYALASNASVFTAPPTLAGAVASYTVAANRWLKANVALSVQVTNRFARGARANVVWTVKGMPMIAVGAPATMTAFQPGGAPVSTDLGPMVGDSSGSVITYALTQNPWNSASLSGSVLTVAVALNQVRYSYRVRVTATNEYDQSVTFTQTVDASAWLAGRWNTPTTVTVQTSQMELGDGLTMAYSYGTLPGGTTFSVFGGCFFVQNSYRSLKYTSFDGVSQTEYFGIGGTDGFGRPSISWVDSAGNTAGWVRIGD